jgi:tetratricopeptide (TPR) repeat protein
MTATMDTLETARTRLTRGAQLLGQKALLEALAQFDEAVALAPDWADARHHQALANVQLGKPDVAEANLRAALELDPRHAAAAHLLGALLCERNALEEALPLLRAAALRAPDNPQFQRDLGVVELFFGNVPAARAAFTHALKMNIHLDEVLYTLVRMTPMQDGSPEAAELMGLLRELESRSEALPEVERSQLQYSLSKVYEDGGDYDAAFDAMSKANALARRHVSYSADDTDWRYEWIAETFDRDLIKRLSGTGDPDRRPIFILGMPRSGTTLVEQIISAHPRVHGAGELVLLPNLVGKTRGVNGAVFPHWAGTLTPGDCKALGQAYLEGLPTPAPGEDFTTDKRLENIEFIGLIHLMLPNATIIHCRRDPRDTLFSCWALRFSNGQEYTYSMDELGRYWRAHERLMAHWKRVLPPGRMLEVSYEGLVAGFETWSRRIIDHCGLEWDDACRRFYESERPVRSASLTQVREPIYARSIGRWMPYEKHLAPLFAAMEADEPAEG